MTSGGALVGSWRAHAKVVALQCADRAAGRTGALDADLRARVAPFLLWRPDGHGADRLIPPRGNPPPARVGAAIFATGRFRAGTTLLWNLFRHVRGVTAFYEPFNPRRWLDPATRGTRVDSRHRGVTSYWDEYLGLEDLAPLFRDRWHERNLFMSADSRDLAMERYVRALIARAPRRPVLQFNRIDLRLPWIRARFPEATIVHVLRNPRDQWCSTLLAPEQFPPDADPNAFSPHDHFYLRQWIADLSGAFPVLREGYATHPYAAFYLLWRLSQAFGLAHADWTFTFEALVREPRKTIAALCSATAIDEAAVPRLAAVVEPIRVGAWADWASEAWFAAHEDAAERALVALATGWNANGR